MMLFRGSHLFEFNTCRKREVGILIFKWLTAYQPGFQVLFCSQAHWRTGVGDDIVMQDMDEFAAHQPTQEWRMLVFWKIQDQQAAWVWSIEDKSSAHTFQTSKLIRESLCRCMDRWMPVRCLNLGSSGGDYDILRFSLQKSRLGPLGPRTHLCSSIAFCLSTSGFYLGFACGSVWAYADGFSTVFRDCFVLLINYFRHIRTIVNISGLSCPCRTSWSLVLADASRIVQRYCVGCRWNLGSFLRWAESRPGGQTKHISLPQETNWTCLAALYNFSY